jgi:hypothetical protein
MIFAREVSGPLTGLVKKINDATAQHKDKKLNSFVVFLTDEGRIAEQLIELAEKEKISETILAFMTSAGPKPYKVAKEANVTVVLYVDSRVKANYPFKKGELRPADVARIMADLGKILPTK